MLACCGLASLPLPAQINVLDIAPPKKVIAKAGSSADAILSLSLHTGFHVNSNTPSESYLIPLKVTWTPGPLEIEAVIYPKPQMEKFPFSEKPLSVFSGGFDVVTHVKAASSALPGQSVLTGKLRYQACNDRMCLAPKTVDVVLPVQIVK